MRGHRKFVGGLVGGCVWGCVVLMALAQTAMASEPSRLWHEAVCTGDFEVSAAAAALERARGVLGGELYPGPSKGAAQQQAEAGECVVFLSTRPPRGAVEPEHGQQNEVRVTHGRARGLSAAAAQAAAALRATSPEAQRDNLAGGEILLDVVVRVGALEDPVLSLLPSGFFGLAEDPPGSRFLLPAEVLAHGIVDPKRRFSRQRLADFERRFPERAGGESVRWRWLLVTRTFAEIDGSTRELIRGQPRQLALDPKALVARAARAGDYLASAVAADGRFVYEYQPGEQRASAGYNLLRHAGAIYALHELHEETHQPHLLLAAERATEYLLEQIQPCGSARAGLCAVERDEAKLGGNALAVLAMLRHPGFEQGADRLGVLSVAVGLGERMLDLLQPSGVFRPHKIQWSTGVASSFESEYYPGEAIFALTRLHRQTGEERWLAASRLAASRRVRDAILRASREGDSEARRSRGLVHDHWLAYGLAELSELRPEPEDAEYLALLADSIDDAQHEGHPALPPDWVGGFYSPPRAAPAATRGEALAAIARTLLSTGGARGARADEDRGFADADLQERLTRALCTAAAFQLRTQFTEERAFYLPDRQRVLGGVSRGLSDLAVRIDYAQHSISNWLALALLQREGRLSCPPTVALPPGPWLPQRPQTASPGSLREALQ